MRKEKLKVRKFPGSGEMDKAMHIPCEFILLMLGLHPTEHNNVGLHSYCGSGKQKHLARNALKYPVTGFI